MTGGPDKIEPERLELRARPRPIRRLNKRTLMIGCAVAALFIAAATIVALRPAHIFKPSDRSELYNTDRKQTAEGLSKLPKSYDEVPKLGPPSPGDVGRAFVESEKKAGTSPSEAPFRANPEEDAERAERIRQVRIGQQAKESGLFVRLSEKLSLRKPPTSGEKTPAEVSAFRPSQIDSAPTAAQLAAKASQNLSDRSSEIIPSSQARKLMFVSTKPDKETTNPHSLAAAPSPYAVVAGTIIPASLITGLNSDLPGETIAQVTENVYDTVTGEYLLIPQGTRLIGKYDSVIAYGQKRALVVWTRLILPDGNSIVIDNLPATDVAGYAGLEDEVDIHTWQLLKGIAMATLLGVGTQLSVGTDESDLVKALRESVQQTTNRAGQRLVEREMDVQPTITVRPGWQLRVIVSKDLVLKPYDGAQTIAKTR